MSSKQIPPPPGTDRNLSWEYDIGCVVSKHSPVGYAALLCGCWSSSANSKLRMALLFTYSNVSLAISQKQRC